VPGKRDRSRWSELEEITIDTFAAQHPLGVYPEKDLISAKQKGNLWEGEEVSVKVKRHTEDQGRRDP